MKYVIIGASAAGITAARTIRNLDDKAKILLISKDENIYSRCMLHHYINGDRDFKKLSFIEPYFFENNKIDWLKGFSVKKLEAKNKKLIMESDKEIFYDKLLIASGASAYFPPIEGLNEANNLLGLRNIEDAVAIKNLPEDVKNIVVLGAGLVGMDAVAGMINHNRNITLIEMADKVLPLQLDDYASNSYIKKLKEHKVNILTSSKAEKIVLSEDKNPQKILLADGREVIADAIVITAGIKPNINFINTDEITVKKGIVVDNKCKTTAKNVWAAGDVCGETPIWPLAVKQAKVAAHNMTGNEDILTDSFGERNAINFFGIPTISIGLVNLPDGDYTEKVIKTKNTYKKFIYKDDILYGAIFQGDISHTGIFKHLINKKISLNEINKELEDINYADIHTG